MLPRLLLSSAILFILTSCHRAEKPRATPTTVKVMKAQRKEAGAEADRCGRRQRKSPADEPR